MHWLKSSHLIWLHLHRQWFLNYDDCRANLCIADETWVGPRDLAQWKRPGTQIKALSFKGGQDCCPWHWWNAPERGDNRWLFFAGSCSRWTVEGSQTSFVQSVRRPPSRLWLELGNWKIQLSIALQNHISILGVQLFGLIWPNNVMENHLSSVSRNNASHGWWLIIRRDLQLQSLEIVNNEANIWKSNIAWFDDKWF